VTKLLFTFSAKIQRYPVEFTFIEIYDRVTGQHDRQWKILSGQIAILGGHCPLTGRYFQPCKGTWLCMKSEKISTRGLRLLFEAMRVRVLHGCYVDDRLVLEAVSEYPAERLRFAPPPILRAEGRAPIEAWQEVMDNLAKTPEKPALTKVAPFKCQVCERVFHLGIGYCSHIACAICLCGWKKCATCKSAWKVSWLDKSPQMNYHPMVFPFDQWYEYLPVTGWYVYQGPDDLVYDSSGRHIIALATGGTLDRM